MEMEQVQEPSNNSEEGSENETDAEFDEEETIRYYFNSGYSYEEILLFLKTRHAYEISYCTLHRRLRQFGLHRRHDRNTNAYTNTVALVRQRITEMVAGPGSLCGYRHLWHSLEMEGLRVPRSVVQILLREIDPESSALRKRNRLQRRRYNNPGPNFAWHIDGYDKLKPWGFPIHGGIDGFSRRMLWLNLTRSNNSPDNIAVMYLKTVEELGICPVELVTDLGTENIIAAAIQSFFRQNPDAHRYVPSPRNQRIEGWWSYFSRSYSKWWRNFFSDLEAQKIIDMLSEQSRECLWYCFSPLIQRDLILFMEHWNTHRIRGSRFNTVSGRPNSLFFLAEYYGGNNNLGLKVQDREINFVSEQIIAEPELNEYQEYFIHVKEVNGHGEATNWQDALKLYGVLMHVAQHGCHENRD